MHYKNTSIIVVVCLIALSCNTASTANTSATKSDNGITSNIWVKDIIENETITSSDIADSLSSIESVSKQVSELYEIMAENLDMDAKLIKELHALAGGKAIYVDKKANIYNDLTSSAYDAPMKLNGASTIYRKAEFIECVNSEVNRPSEYYLPDALYSVSYDIKALMSQRKYYNRGEYQEYFNTLTDETRDSIIFYEAVLLYTGEKAETVDNLFVAYMKILTAKDANEYIIEIDNNKCKIKDEYIEILKSYNFNSTTTLNYLAIMLSYDENIATYDNTEYVTNTNIIPYIKNYTSRENMLVAAVCLTGKVRYVWGGGHDGTSDIDGINPSWYYFNSLYPSDASIQGFGTCIRSTYYWCPMHGTGTEEFHGCSIYSASDYLNERKELIGYSNYTYDDYMSILSQIDFNYGINEHLLDGLDCSGYASWVYNQITDKYSFDASAMYFTEQEGIEELALGSELLPGDIFAWNLHMIMIVGKVDNNSKAYVTIEQTPNVLRFGCVYYSGASSNDINEALEIANQANELIGGIDREDEPAKAYCMNTVGYYTEEVSSTPDTLAENDSTLDNESNDIVETIIENDNIVTEGVIETESNETETESNETETESNENLIIEEKYYTAIGRYKDRFIDEDTIIEKYGVSIKDMTAQQIIEYTLTKLPVSYVLGYDVYEGKLFNKEIVSSDIGVTISTSNE